MTTNSTDRTSGLGGGVAIKAPCRAATTANITLSGLQTINGIVCVAGDSVLVKNQTTASENGIYLVSATAWTRRADCDGARDLVTGTQVQVLEGTNVGTWRVTTTGTITVGTTSLAFAVDTNTGTGNGDMIKAENLSGLASDVAAFDNISPLTTAGDILYHDGTNNVRLPKGTSGQFLKIGASIPAWDTPAGSGDMLKSENLSGMADYTTARSNLGLGALAVKATVATADIDAAAVTYAKIQNVAANKVLGSIAGGAPEEITCTSAGRAILDDADAAAQRTTLGLDTMATQAASAVAITGGTITGLGSPSAASDAVNKAYADAIASGIQPKSAVVVATTTTLPANTYANGASGVGATLTGNAVGAFAAVDGVTLTVNQRILVKNESTGANNGIYQLSTVGDGATAYVLTRVTDADEAAELSFCQVTVQSGTVNGNTKFQCITTSITVGTTALTFTRDYSGISAADKAKLDAFALWVPSDATGATDMTTELQNFVAANQGRITKVKEGSTILLNNAFSAVTTGHIEIDFTNAIVKRNSGTTSAIFCDNVANASAEKTVSTVAEATINNDSTVTTLTISGTLSALKYDWVAVYSDDLNPAETGDKYGEIVQLIKDEAALVLHCTRRLNRHTAYTSNVRIRKLDATRRVMIRGGIFMANGDSDDTAITSRGTGDIVIRGFVAPKVSGCVFDGNWSTGVRLQCCAAWDVQNLRMQNVGNLAGFNIYLYLLSVYGMNDSGCATHLVGVNGRHSAFTTDGDSSPSNWYEYGIPTNCVFDGVYGFNTFASVADTHPEGDGIIIRNVVSFNSRQDLDGDFTGLAIQIRSANTIVDGVSVFGQNRAIVVTAVNHGFEDQVEISNVKYFQLIDKKTTDRDVGIDIKDQATLANKRHVRLNNISGNDVGICIRVGRTAKCTINDVDFRRFDTFMDVGAGAVVVSTGGVALDYRNSPRSAAYNGVVCRSDATYLGCTAVFMSAPRIIKGDASNKPTSFFVESDTTATKYVYAPPLVEYNPSGVTPTALYQTGATTFSVVSVSGTGSGGLQSSNNLSDVANITTAFNTITPLTAKGDILVGFGANDSRRLAKPIENNKVLVTDNAQTLGIKWTDFSIGLLTYNQGGTGAVARSVTSRLQEMPSVKDFGATGDGVTNDFTSFQNALNNLASVGNLRIPAGAYRIDGALTYPSGSGVNNKYNIDIDPRATFSGTHGFGTSNGYYGYPPIFSYNEIRIHDTDGLSSGTISKNSNLFGFAVNMRKEGGYGQHPDLGGAGHTVLNSVGIYTSVSGYNGAYIWGMNPVVTLKDNTGGAAIAIEVNPNNEAADGAEVYGVVISSGGTYHPVSALQIQASGSGTTYSNGIIFLPTSVESTNGSLIYAPSGTFKYGINFGSCAFTNGYILFSQKFKLENSGQLDFAGFTPQARGVDTGQGLPIKVGGVQYKLPLHT